jgi:Holliday junction resolvase RusA-like endonuclease
MGRGGHFYSPSSIDEKLTGGEIYLQFAIKHKSKLWDTTIPINVKIHFHYKSGRGRTPDVDNLLKFALDAIEKSGIVKNDRLITVKEMTYDCSKTENPRTEIIIEEIEVIG